MQGHPGHPVPVAPLGKPEGLQRGGTPAEDGVPQKWPGAFTQCVCADDLVAVAKGQHRGCTELIPWEQTCPWSIPGDGM